MATNQAFREDRALSAVSNNIFGAAIPTLSGSANSYTGLDIAATISGAYTLASLYGIHLEPTVTGTLTTLYGIKVLPTGAGTVTNKYLLYSDSAYGTNQWIYGQAAANAGIHANATSVTTVGGVLKVDIAGSTRYIPLYNTFA